MMNLSTTIPITLVNHLKYYDQFRIIHGILVKISFPYIFLIASIGLITNTSTVLLLSKNFVTKNLKNRWTLIALALSDLLFNIALLIRGVHDIVRAGSDRLCLVISFLSHLAEFLSACYTVSFTIQRFTAVRYPFQAAAQRRSSPITSLLFIFILSALFCFALSYRNKYVDCHEELQLNWFIADAFISFVIPFSLILVYNILIVNFIRKHSRSPITVQSTLLRRNMRSKTNGKTYHRDETCDTDNNTMVNGMSTIVNCDEIENLDVKYKKDENKISIKTENQLNRPLIALSSDKVNSETSSNRRSSISTLRQLIQPKVFYNNNNNARRSSVDSISFRLSGIPSNHSIDNDGIGCRSTRTSQSIRVTRMLVLVSTCFLLLNAPAHLCVIALKIYTTIDAPILNEYNEQSKNLTNYPIQNFVSINESYNTADNGTIIDDQITIHLFYIVVLLTQLISYASYSINFFLYSFSGITFRTSLRQIILKFRRH